MQHHMLFVFRILPHLPSTIDVKGQSCASYPLYIIQYIAHLRAVGTARASAQQQVLWNFEQPRKLK